MEASPLVPSSPQGDFLQMRGPGQPGSVGVQLADDQRPSGMQRLNAALEPGGLLRCRAVVKNIDHNHRLRMAQCALARIALLHLYSLNAFQESPRQLDFARIPLDCADADLGLLERR